jgi:hypothetical protein
MFTSREDGLRSGRTRRDSAEPSNSGNTRWLVLAGTAAVGAMLRTLLSRRECWNMSRTSRISPAMCKTFSKLSTRANMTEVRTRSNLNRRASPSMPELLLIDVATRSTTCAGPPRTTHSDTHGDCLSSVLPTMLNCASCLQPRSREISSSPLRLVCYPCSYIPSYSRRRRHGRRVVQSRGSLREAFTRGNAFAKTQTVDSGIAVSDSLGYVGHKDIAGPLPVCVLLLPRPRTIAASG